MIIFQKIYLTRILALLVFSHNELSWHFEILSYAQIIVLAQWVKLTFKNSLNQTWLNSYLWKIHDDIALTPDPTSHTWVSIMDHACLAQCTSFTLTQRRWMPLCASASASASMYLTCEVDSNVAYDLTKNLKCVVNFYCSIRVIHKDIYSSARKRLPRIR